MFVQHMVAKFKTTGRMATIMPHGVLFEGGSEKKSGRKWLTISLKPLSVYHLLCFYGTGIPACVIVINKTNPMHYTTKSFSSMPMRNMPKAKCKNILRPEDIEKIDYVFTHKPDSIDKKYARLVDLEEIKTNDYNMNIRRYVDNTPDPEPRRCKSTFNRWNSGWWNISQQSNMINSVLMLLKCSKPEAKSIRISKSDEDKSHIKTCVEANANLQGAYSNMQQQVNDWWQNGEEDFASLAPHKQTIEEAREVMPKMDLLNLW